MSRAVGGAAVLIPVWFAAQSGLFRRTIDNPVSAFGYAGIFAIHMWTRPGKRECAATLLLAALLRAAYVLVFSEPATYFGAFVIRTGVFLGAASMLVLIARTLQLKGERRRAKLRTLMVNVFFLYLALYLGFYLNLVSAVVPYRYDLFLYALDQNLGNPSFIFGRLLARSPVIWNLEAIIYYALPLALAILYAAHANGSRKWPISILKVLLLNAGIGFALYFVYPAAGPKYAFAGAFPFHAPAVSGLEPLFLAAPPNAMPSLHIAGAVLVWWNMRPWFWGRLAAGLFLLLTALATLGTGEHYLVDLVVALPYALAIHAAGSTTKEHSLALAAGGCITVAWLALLRFRSPVLLDSWVLRVLCLSTVIAIVAIERRLAHSIFTGQPRLRESLP